MQRNGATRRTNGILLHEVEKKLEQKGQSGNKFRGHLFSSNRKTHTNPRVVRRKNNFCLTFFLTSLSCRLFIVLDDDNGIPLCVPIFR